MRIFIILYIIIIIIILYYYIFFFIIYNNNNNSNNVDVMNDYVQMTTLQFEANPPSVWATESGGRVIKEYRRSNFLASARSAVNKIFP